MTPGLGVGNKATATESTITKTAAQTNVGRSRSPFAPRKVAMKPRGRRVGAACLEWGTSSDDQRPPLTVSGLLERDLQFCREHTDQKRRILLQHSTYQRLEPLLQVRIAHHPIHQRVADVHHQLWRAETGRRGRRGGEAAVSALLRFNTLML